MRKILLVVATVVVVLVLAVAIGVPWFLSGDGIRQTLEQQATSWLGHPVRIGGVRAQIFPRPGIALSDITVGEPVRLTLGGVRLSTDLRALVGRRIEDARVVISNSRIQMPLPFQLPESDTAAPEEGAAEAGGMQLVSVSEISLRDITIASRDREVTVSADSTLTGTHLTLRQFSAESGATSLQVEGEVDLEPRIDAKLRATAGRLDLDELLALATAFAPERPAAGSARRSAPASQPARIAATLTAERATAAGVEMSDLTTDMNVDGDRVSLSPLAFGLFGGRYEGSLTARLAESMSATLQSKLQNLDVAQLAAFGESPDTITGTLSGAGSFSAQGADLAAILATATGKGEVSIVDGTIKRLNFVRTVVLFFGRPAPETQEATDRFERMDATFSLARQVFRADTFALRSRDADISGSGTLTLDSQALEGTLTMMLSEELSAQAGTDLIRFTREGNRVVLPAKLGGTLEAPRISIDASAALKRGVQNEIQRRVGGFLERLRGKDDTAK